MRKLIFILAFANVCAIANAQTDSLKSKTLDEVLISATRLEQRVIETPRSAVVISSDAIRSSSYNSVGELLSKQPGIYLVGGNQTPGTNQSLFMRGANSNQVVIMMDGVRITDPSSPNNAVDLSELSLTNVERIEIIEGAHSTVYGGGAVGGVINIVTKKNGNKGFHGNASLQPATFGGGTSSLTSGANINYNFENGFYLNGSLYDQHVNGLTAATLVQPAYGGPHQDAFRKTDGYFKAGYRKNKLDAFASYKRSTQHADIPTGAFKDDDNNYVNFLRDQLNYSISYQLKDKLKLVGNGSWSKSERLNENDSSKVSATSYDGNYSKATYHGTLNNNEVQLNYTGKKIKGIVGGGIFYEGMNFNSYFYSSQFGGYASTTNYDSLQPSATTKYGFAHASWRGGADNKFGLAGGVRFSNHSLFGNFFTFDFNPSLALTSSSLLYGSISSGYNAPSLYQLFDPSFGGFTTLGNKNLKPEQTVSYEVGAKKDFQNGSYFTAAVFLSKTNHLIDYVYLWNKDTSVPNLSYLDYLGDTYLNLSEQVVRGVQLSGKWMIHSKLNASGNLTLIDGTITYSQSNLDTTKTGGNHVQLFTSGNFIQGEGTFNNLVRRPQVTAFGELRYLATAQLTTFINYRVAGRRNDSYYDPTLGPFGALNQNTVASYHLVDIGAIYQLKKWMSISLKVENIFDVKYSEILGYNTRGRSGYLKLNFIW